MKSISEIDSIINGSKNPLDDEKALTFIDFIKVTGIQGNSDTVLKHYKEYLTSWATYREDCLEQSNNEFVRANLIEVLKTIALSYSSYEEQRFIANINWGNESEVKNTLPLFAKKIEQICAFYRNKRDNVQKIVYKSSFRGSTRSIEEIVYQKIIDFIFDNRNVLASYADIRRNLFVSVENYVDIFGEYFDYDREEEQDIDAVDIDPQYFTNDNILGDLLFGGDATLKEIPLIAQLGLDLGGECVGDALALRDTLLAGSKMDQLGLEEAVRIKRKIYQKYLGTDLYYIYSDQNKNITYDVLARAENPTGNLLNVSTSDIAGNNRSQYKLLSKLGLFFKPDKISVLKINAKEYTWTVDTSKLEPNTWYIFPDPNKYGDIGVNKNPKYPLMMTYKLNYDVKNFSSGTAMNDPLLFMAEETWRGYYSLEDDIFRFNKNDDWSHGFTAVIHGENPAAVKDIKKDMFGNEIAIFDSNLAKTALRSNESVGEQLKETKTERFENTNRNFFFINGGYFMEPSAKDVSTRFDFKLSKVVIDEEHDYLNRTGITINNATQCQRVAQLTNSQEKVIMFPNNFETEDGTSFQSFKLNGITFATANRLATIADEQPEYYFKDHYNYIR